MVLKDDWKLDLEVFEGPLDLLLFLVRKEEILITDIPIHKITQQYLEYLHLMKMLDLNIAGEYLVMASTLLYIKSRMLLPEDPDKTAEEEIEDPRSQLVEQLLEYKKYKEAGEFLKHREEESQAFFRRGAREVADAREKELDLSIFDLLASFSRVLKTLEARKPEEIFFEEVSVDEKIRSLGERLRTQTVLRFGALFDALQSRYQVIATFLALLELIKTGCARVFQKDKHDEIVIKWADPEPAAPAQGQQP